MKQADIGAILFRGTLWFIDANQVAALVRKHRLPTIHNLREFVEAGALYVLRRGLCGAPPERLFLVTLGSGSHRRRPARGRRTAFVAELLAGDLRRRARCIALRPTAPT